MSKLYYCRQTTEKCKSIRYPSKFHPYKYGTSGCIYTSGCGVCASLMVLHNFGFTGLDTAAWTQKCLLMGARSADGTNMDTVAAFLERHFSIVSKRAKTVADLKNHLKAGGKAIVCVSGGGKQLFSNGGHYVYVGGLDKSGNLIVLDPYWYDGKFTMTDQPPEVHKGQEWPGKCMCSLRRLASDLSGIWLFTNAKGEQGGVCGKRCKLPQGKRPRRPPLSRAHTSPRQCGEFTRAQVLPPDAKRSRI